MAYTTFALVAKMKNSKTVYVVILDTMNLFLTAGVFVVCIFLKRNFSHNGRSAVL